MPSHASLPTQKLLLIQRRYNMCCRYCGRYYCKCVTDDAKSKKKMQSPFMSVCSQKFPKRATSIFRNLWPNHLFPFAPPPPVVSIALVSSPRDISLRQTPSATGSSGEVELTPAACRLFLASSSNLTCAPCTYRHMQHMQTHAAHAAHAAHAWVGVQYMQSLCCAVRGSRSRGGEARRAIAGEY